MANEAEQQRLYRVRHSLAHVMAQAVVERYPQAKMGIGPPIDTGFYYDFDLGPGDDGRPRSFTPEDLEQIERRMRQIIGQRFPFEYRELSAEDARTQFAEQPYKLELIDAILAGGADEYGQEQENGAEPVLSTYRQSDFEDLCRGPHVEHTGKIPSDAFTLMNVAGAYWRGDEHKPMLQRIYGTAWLRKQDLREHLQMLEEARKRDHRRLGQDLELFTFDDEVGPGLPLWLPRGVEPGGSGFKWRQVLPDVPGCHRFAAAGASGAVPFPTDPLAARTHRDGGYGWQLWRRYECCENPCRVRLAGPLRIARGP